MSVLFIQEFIGKSAAVLASDGQHLADFLTERAQKGEPVSLSFKGLRHVTTAFLHAAVGTVLLQIPEFDKLLRVQDVESSAVELKLTEVRRMALDVDYRQQIEEGMAEALAA